MVDFVRTPRRIQPTYPAARESARRGAREIADALFAKRTRLGVIDWVEQNIKLPASSPKQGLFNFAYTPYLRGILEALVSPTFTYGSVVKAGQLGFSIGVLCNYIGYTKATKPENIVLMLPSEGEAEKFSKDKIRNLIENSDAVRNAFGATRSRDPDNSILLKRTRAGTFLTLLGSNSTAATRSSTNPILLFDEVDEYIADVDQGDIIKLMMRAQIQYGLGRKKVMVGSTPTVWLDAPDGDDTTREIRGKGSRAYREFLDGNRQQWYSTCPSCRDTFVLDFFRHVKWPKAGTPLERANAAYYCCPHGCHLPRELQQTIVGQQDAWRSTNPHGLYPSWNIGGELSFAPGMQINELALELLAAGKDPTKLRPFYNLKLGRVFKEIRTPIVVQSLRDRRELYAAEVPRKVGLLTCQVDVQRNPARLEVLITGWGAGEESWRIHHYRLNGDVKRLEAAEGQEPTPWQRLSAILKRRYVHESGVALKITRTVIDSADGEMTDIVYKYVLPRQSWGVLAVRGEKDFDGITRKSATMPELYREGKASATGVRLVLMNTYALKDRLFGRIPLLPHEGPGAMHWPLLPDDSPEFPPDYWPQWKNESKISRKKHKNSIEMEDVYVKTGPNESIDLDAYGILALETCGADVIKRLPDLVAEICKRGAAAQAGMPLPSKKSVAVRRHSGGFDRPRG